MDMEIIVKVCTSLFYWKLNYNYSKIPCSVEMKSKQQNKICGITKTKFVVFYYKIFIDIFTPQNYVSNIEFFPLELPSLGSPKSHHHDSKRTSIQNSNIQCSMINPYPDVLFIQNHVIILPL